MDHLDRIARRREEHRKYRVKRDAESERRKLPLVPEPYPDGVQRPKTRGECEGGARPCPFVSCRWNLFLVVSATGRIETRAGEPWEQEHSCALDVADRDGATLFEVGAALGITEEAVHQTEKRAKRKFDRLREWKASQSNINPSKPPS